jgi:hypothetical protein
MQVIAASAGRRQEPHLSYSVVGTIQCLFSTERGFYSDVCMAIRAGVRKGETKKQGGEGI